MGLRRVAGKGEGFYLRISTSRSLVLKWFQSLAVRERSLDSLGGGRGTKIDTIANERSCNSTIQFALKTCMIHSPMKTAPFSVIQSISKIHSRLLLYASSLVGKVPFSEMKSSA